MLHGNCDVEADFSTISSISTLYVAYDIREVQKIRRLAQEPLLPFSRAQVWRIATGIMIEAGISDAPHRTCKRLRHGFGIYATTNGIQFNMLKKWMGHASIETRAIYADAVGKEVQDIAARMWS